MPSTISATLIGPLLEVPPTSPGTSKKDPVLQSLLTRSSNLLAATPLPPPVPVDILPHPANVLLAVAFLNIPQALRKVLTVGTYVVHILTPLRVVLRVPPTFNRVVQDVLQFMVPLVPRIVPLKVDKVGAATLAVRVLPHVPVCLIVVVSTVRTFLLSPFLHATPKPV